MHVVVGRIGRPHGIRGAVTVETRTDEPDVRFAPGSVLLTESGELLVERSMWHSGRLLVEFRGIEDRNAAEGLRGLLLHVDRSEHEVPEDPEEFYDSALQGCTAELPDGTVLGTVDDVLHLPAQDLLVVRTPDDREVLVPFVRQMVPTVDVAARRVVIDPPAGLLDPPEDRS